MAILTFEERKKMRDEYNKQTLKSYKLGKEPVSASKASGQEKSSSSVKKANKTVYKAPAAVLSFNSGEQAETLLALVNKHGLPLTVRTVLAHEVKTSMCPCKKNACQVGVEIKIVGIEMMENEHGFFFYSECLCGEAKTSSGRSYWFPTKSVRYSKA